MLRQHKIRLFKPSVGKSELNAINKIFKKSWIGYGPKVKEFEKIWCNYFNVKHSIGVNSCTAALHSALAVNKFKKGKKVLVPGQFCGSSKLPEPAGSVAFC